MIDSLSVLKEARSLGSVATLTQVQTAMATIDRTPLTTTESARYRTEIWDEISPLGGQPPEYWRQRGDWPQGGKVYLVYRDSQLLYVQPHDPDQAGHAAMSDTSALASAAAHQARLVEQSVDAEVMRQVLLQVL